MMLLAIEPNIGRKEIFISIEKKHREKKNSVQFIIYFKFFWF